MSMNGVPQGDPRDWDDARAVRAQLQELRIRESTKSAEFDSIIARLRKQGNSGYVIAAELGMERPTVARIFKRTEPKKRVRKAAKKKPPAKKAVKKIPSKAKAVAKRTAVRK